MRFTYYGVRGSVPTPGPSTIRLGGNTPCVAVWCGESLIILDAGTGIRVLGDELMSGPFGEGKGRATLLVSHTHWDHIQGFPFFAPAYIHGNELRLLGSHTIHKGLETALHHQQQYQNFPVLLSQMPARMSFQALSEGEELAMSGIKISAGELHHPGGASGYRLDFNGHTLVYATDTEHYANTDLRLMALCQGADVLIYDATYTPQEYANHSGWGHSTWAEGIKLAKTARVKALHLFHHHPNHDDDFMEKVLEEARKHFPETYLAREGWEVNLGK
ncbi:MAG: MBL fold metallo-hydrolase [Thermodesulfobacteriota bacterium]